MQISLQMVTSIDIPVHAKDGKKNLLCKTQETLGSTQSQMVLKKMDSQN